VIAIAQKLPLARDAAIAFGSWDTDLPLPTT
jgi:hypothetical protein